jgi:cephalosporin hydroxylase
MEHFWYQIQRFTFFNYQNVYDRMIAEAPANARFVEIGVWKGQSVCYAAVEIARSGKNIKIDAIDTWQGSPQEPQIMEDPSIVNGTLYDEFIRNIEPVKHIVTPIRDESTHAALQYYDKSLDFVFIDGSHLYEAVKADIAAWLPKVKTGGYIGGHDFGNPEEFNGVQKAVTEAFEGQHIEIYNIGWGSWLKKV